MNNFAVRAFVETDESAVAALWQLTLPDDAPRNAPGKVIRRKLTTQRELFLVGVLGGSPEERIVGTVLAGYDGCRGWIYHLAVHPDHQRAGFGRRIMEVAETSLRQLGCPKINLQVRAENSGVVRFYESLGYSVEERLSLGKVIE